MTLILHYVHWVSMRREVVDIRAHHEHWNIVQGHTVLVRKVYSIKKLGGGEETP